MSHRGVSFLCLCIVVMQLLQVVVGLLPIDDPEVRAHLEAKVISSMSLKNIEEMVENDERVINAPKSKLIIIPKKKNAEGLLTEDDRDAIIIHRKPKQPYKQDEPVEYRFPDIDFDRGVRRSSYDPIDSFESGFRHHEEDIPSLFSMSDLESAGSEPAHKFYESIVDSMMSGQKFGLSRDPFELLSIAASEHVPHYKPRFDYDAYSKDSTETKLKGKPYWKDAPERREEMVDENGCRTVIKKMVDPEDEKKKSGSEKAKTVVITKECEYPNLNGPDAKIIEATPIRDTARFDSDSSSEYTSYDDQAPSYEKTRPEELNFKSSEGRDPLAPDYIDTMLDRHFKSFPAFSNPLSSFRGYQERFKLRIPEAFKDVKPTVGVQTYEYSHPKSGLDEERQSSSDKDSVNNDSPRAYEHHYHYDYPPQKSRKPEYDDDQEVKQTAKSTNPKDPKMMKKSFAYYRKDNPKDDPNDHQYAEEYAQGNFRSFSSSYDSEKDGPKKQ